MARVETIIEIAAPAKLVFAYFVPQRMPYWYGVEIGATLEISGGAADFAAGQKARITGRAGRGPRARELSLTAVVTAYEWERLLEWRFKDAFGVSGLQRWEIQALAAPPAYPESAASSFAPETRVRMLDAYRMPTALSRLFDYLFTRHAIARRNRDSLSRLRHLCEKK